MDEDLFDDERISLDELEQRCVEIGSPVAAAVAACGYEFDAETFVLAEVARVAIARGVDPETAIGYFEERGFVARAVESIESSVA